jgi:hypothetical protein
MTAAFAIQSGFCGENDWRAYGAVFGICCVAAYTVLEKNNSISRCIPENTYFCSRSVAIMEQVKTL